MRLAEPFTFFIDRSLGSGIVPSAIRGCGEAVVVHDDHFADDTTDVAWLSEAGRRTNALERTQLLSAGVAAFMLGRGDLRGSEMAHAFTTALPRMKTALRRSELAIIAVVAADGGVSVLYAAGKRLPKPRKVR